PGLTPCVSVPDVYTHTRTRTHTHTHTHTAQWLSAGCEASEQDCGVTAVLHKHSHTHTHTHTHRNTHTHFHCLNASALSTTHITTPTSTALYTGHHDLIVCVCDQ